MILETNTSSAMQGNDGYRYEYVIDVKSSGEYLESFVRKGVLDLVIWTE